MQKELRKRHILETLHSDAALEVSRLAAHFKVAAMTIRRDLAELEHEGYLVRRYGGAVKLDPLDNMFNFAQRVAVKREQKEAICRRAAEFIEDGDVVFIDSGTTPFRICRYLNGQRHLRIITHSLPIVSEMINLPSIKINLLGGEVDSGRRAVYGAVTEREISGYRATKAFIGADGVSLANGLSAFVEKDAHIAQKMAEQADRVYLLCDSSKLERDSYYRFSSLKLVDALITDPGVPQALLNKYKRNKINIIITKGE